MQRNILILLLMLAGINLAGTRAYGQNNKQKQETQYKQVYTCPMHPEVIKDKPGKCPKCGMTLEKQKESGMVMPKDQTKMKKRMADTTQVMRHTHAHRDSLHMNKKTIPDSTKKMMDK